MFLTIITIISTLDFLNFGQTPSSYIYLKTGPSPLCDTTVDWTKITSLTWNRWVTFQLICHWTKIISLTWNRWVTFQLTCRCVVIFNAMFQGLRARAQANATKPEFKTIQVYQELQIELKFFLKRNKSSSEALNSGVISLINIDSDLSLPLEVFEMDFQCIWTLGFVSLKSKLICYVVFRSGREQAPHAVHLKIHKNTNRQCNHSNKLITAFFQTLICLLNQLMHNRLFCL